VRNNVVDGAGIWLNINTQDDYWPLRVSTDNRAVDNWYTQGKVRGSWNAYNGNVASNNQKANSEAWPAAARKVVENAGIQPDAGVPRYGTD
jgi:hypothetical protein